MAPHELDVAAELVGVTGVADLSVPRDAPVKAPSVLLTPSMTLAPGTTLGPYQIISQLGSGGMGVVHEGRDPRLKRTVADTRIGPHARPEQL